MTLPEKSLWLQVGTDFAICSYRETAFPDTLLSGVAHLTTFANANEW